MKQLLLLVILLLVPMQLLANATIVAQRGVTTTGSENTMVSKLQVGDLVPTGTTITTSLKSFVVLQFTDGARVTVRPNSTMIIEEYSYLEGNDAVRLNLVSGGLRVVTGAIAKSNPEAYKVATPVALMGVRGTEFSVQLLD
jgi:hypothetical protein